MTFKEYVSKLCKDFVDCFGMPEGKNILTEEDIDRIIDSGKYPDNCNLTERQKINYRMRTAFIEVGMFSIEDKYSSMC
ncbi:hypothetical protein HYZ41_04315 [archaeon]|nr:hypothetical protein [archaeon]